MGPQDLLEKARSPKVAFHRFVLLHREQQTDLFCFFEGYDTHYYFPRINNLNEDNHTIICGNKKSVLESHEFIVRKYPNYKTLFFVDSDFDETKSQPNLYVTIGYSIENFYCTANVLSRILRNEFFLKITDLEYLKILELFHKRQKEFHKASSLFNLWYYTAKLKAAANSTFVNASLNDKFVKDFISYNRDNTISANYTLEDIKAKFPNAIDISEAELNSCKEEFYKKDPILRFRGKYELEFFLKFLTFLINDSNKEKIILKKKTKFRFDPAIALSQLSQYAETTECLKDFLTKST